MEIDGLFFDIGENFTREPRHAHFRITHRGRRIAINRSKISLTVNQRIAHREILRHAHDRVVNRGVAVRMILTDDVADDARALLVGLVIIVAELIHRPQHATVDGL